MSAPSSAPTRAACLTLLALYSIVDLGTPRIDHRHERDLPLRTALADLAELAEHLVLGFGAQIDVDGDGVGPELDGLLDGANEFLRVRIGAQARPGGKVNDQADIVPRAAVAGPDHALVHQNGIRPAGDHLADGGPHVRQALDGAHRDAVVHRDDDCLARVAVDDSFESYCFADHGQTSKRIDSLS